MILVDTSVWVDHMRRSNERLAGLLDAGHVLCHPFVVGELACGNLVRRDRILGLLNDLPEAPVAEHAEVLQLVQSRRVYGQGLGWIDMHLMASSLLARCQLWSLDKRLHAAAQRLRAV